MAFPEPQVVDSTDTAEVVSSTGGTPLVQPVRRDAKGQRRLNAGARRLSKTGALSKILVKPQLGQSKQNFGFGSFSMARRHTQILGRKASYSSLETPGTNPYVLPQTSSLAR
ncbi:hypothetical protein M8J75_007206 [Diaphorina citri]|nr:hypothetical protein M8J75_007206 [Diaphorina citri]